MQADSVFGGLLYGERRCFIFGGFPRYAENWEVREGAPLIPEEERRVCTLEATTCGYLSRPGASARLLVELTLSSQMFIELQAERRHNAPTRWLIRG